MKTLLVPLDGSIHAEQALPYAQQLAKLLAARVCLLRVIPEVYRDQLFVDSFAMIYTSERDIQQDPTVRAMTILRERAEGYLDQRAEPLRADGIVVDCDVWVGPAAEIISDVAVHLEAELIIMATHGYSGLRRWAAGSVADKVVHSSTTPVLLVHGGNQPGAAVPTFKHMLVPLDGSEFGDQALPIAARIAELAGAGLTLLHAIDPLAELAPAVRPIGSRAFEHSSIISERCGQAQHQLDAHATILGNTVQYCETLSLIGYPAEVIVDEARRREVDLIVMATHGYSGLKRWALGSVADKVLHTTQTPLLLVRVKQTKA